MKRAVKHRVNKALGEFFIQLMDQTIEETVNRDTKVANRICKYIVKPRAVSLFFLTAEH